MNRTKGTILQSMIRRERERHIRGGYGWPGKEIKAPAATRYPNLVAELGWSAPWLYLLADFAEVTPEIMAAALEDNEELTGLELYRLSRFLGVPMAYLTAPTLQVIDPDTNKGLARKKALVTMIEEAGNQGCWQRSVKWVLTAFEIGEPVTYAEYRWAINELQDSIRYREQRLSVRTTRRVTA